jgi:imidazolonepropionase-like amidohydrolase
MKLTILGKAAVVLLSLLFPANGRVSAQIIAVTAGTLIDPDTGTEKPKQIILIDGGTIVAVGPELQIPSDAKRIDLSHETVLPRLIDAHTHLLASVDAKWDLGDFWIMAMQRRAGWRAIQGGQHAKEMLESGFTTVRDVGNSGDHLDTDLDKAIRFGLVPGPTMVFSS